MATLLVPTDLSANSKAGIRFSLQLEKQGEYDLVFYHCLPYLRPTRWSDERYARHAAAENEKAVKELSRFIKGIYRSAGMPKAKVTCVVQQSPDAQKAIVDYAGTMGADAICMSTRGAGRLKKLLGTNTSGIIHSSHIPVFVIPKGYRRTPMKQVLYASDFNDLARELEKVRTMAAAFKAKVVVYHYDYLANVREARQDLEKMATLHRGRGVSFKFRKFNVGESLAHHVMNDARTVNASLVVLFTDQKRGWFDRIFRASDAIDTALDPKVPLLIFPKD